MGTLELAGKRFEGRFGVQGVGVVVGGAHLLPDPGGEVIGQVVLDIADLVKLAPTDHRVVEHCLHRGGERLAPVDHDQDRAGHVQAPVPQPGAHREGQQALLGGLRHIAHGDLHRLGQRPHTGIPLSTTVDDGRASAAGSVFFAVTRPVPARPRLV
jgi:hypothetical protein